jgi:hypothetical protein
MSALGHEQTSRNVRVMSVIRLKADIHRSLIDWMARYGAFWRDRFDRLEILLKRMDQ